MTVQTSGTGKESQTPAPSTSRRMQGETIGKALRAQYEAVLAEPVPKDLLDLLDALEKRETGT